MAGQHSILSPSGAHRWMRCPGSAALEKGIPDRGSRYADEGSAAHLVASECMKTGATEKPEDFLGRMLDMGNHSILVDQDMVGFVEKYIVLVHKYAEGGGQIITDKRVDFSDRIGIPNSTGTVDNGVIFPDRIVGIDLKYGMGVRVDAEDNEQLLLYMIGLLNDYGMLVEPEDLVMVIHQPRLEHISEACITTETLDAFGEKAEIAAHKAMAMYNGEMEIELVPGEKQCRFCKAKATCPALRDEVQQVVGAVATRDDFADLMSVKLDWLSAAMQRVPLVEHWCLAIRAEMERRLFAGEKDENFKLVEGRQGNRAWTDEEAAEKKLKAFRYRPFQIYKTTLISPTTAEKLLKPKPERWGKMQNLITRAPGKPSVAPAADKRPALALTSIAEEFRDLIANSEEE